ncbi:DUF6267 family protein, partial [Arthrospira platensis SPKY1]|nr:DUF6267 family protein [Arthrospira platensis SPKY1]
KLGNTSYDPAKMTSGLMRFIEEKFQKKIDSMKSDLGKDKWKNAMNAELNYVKLNQNSFLSSFELLKLLTHAKQIVINKLETLNSVRSFVADGNGYSTTTGEGFVISDKLGDNAVKLVDRFEFSRLNFTLPKQWD